MVRSVLLPCLCVALWLAPPARARAQSSEQASDQGEDTRKDADADRTYVNVRVGMASSNRNGRPELCVEGAPLAMLSFEACGTGAQVWHEDPAPEIAHFRAKARLLSRALRRFVLQGFVGAGFAELQVGKDAGGFTFRGPGAGRTSTAGAELSLSARALVPLPKSFELLVDLNLAAAYLPHADELVTPRSRFQPTVGASVGVGF